MSSSVEAKLLGVYSRPEDRPRAPPAMASATSALIRSSSAADGRPVGVAHGRGPDRPVPDEGRVIERGPRLLDRGQEAGDVLPIRGQAVLLGERFAHLGGLFVRQRERRAAALAADERRHALPDGALGPGIDEQADIGVVVDVDEAGRDGEAVGLDRRPRPAKRAIRPIARIRPSAMPRSARKGGPPDPS